MPTPGPGELGGHLWPLVQKQLPPSARDVQLTVRSLSGGLISDCVVEVRARFTRADGSKGTSQFVLKRLDGVAVREAHVYERLLRRAAPHLAPQLYDVAAEARGATHLYLEAIRPATRWPWRDLALSAMVLERISHLHELSPQPLAHAIDDWSYTRELEGTARHTVELLERRAATDPSVRRDLPAAYRFQARLGEVREQLHRFVPLPPTFIHGDLHPGNVIVRRRAGGREPIFIDWARSRVGSPLEDVTSWLQWVGFWEPQVRQRHDTLLGIYLEARGLSRTPSRAVRHAYWLASACNCYAGVVSYHLAVASETRPGAARHERALAAVRDCLRVIRRADAYLRS